MFYSRLAVLIVIACAGAGCTCGAASSAGNAAADLRVLVFSRTEQFRHESIPHGIAALVELGRVNRFTVDATEEPQAFCTANLQRYRAVVFLNTTGDVLDEQQQSAFESFIRAGGGFVGIHSAADTEPNWPWYCQLLGARFKNHPSVQPADVVIADRAHSSTCHLPSRWRRTDEWYNFAWCGPDNGQSVHVLARVDETTYGGGTMGADHPIAWCQEFDGGRSWYTAGGHTIESFSEPLFLRHLLEGIRWAADARTQP